MQNTVKSLFTPEQNVQIEPEPSLDADIYTELSLGRYGVTRNAKERVESDAEANKKVACMLAQWQLNSNNNVVLVITLPCDGLISGLSTGGYAFMTIDEMLLNYPVNPIEMIERCLVNISKTIKHPTK